MSKSPTASLPSIALATEGPCPYCGETITMILDLSVAQQSYVEDCTICCRPIEVHYSVADGVIERFGAVRSSD